MAVELSPLYFSRRVLIDPLDPAPIPLVHSRGAVNPANAATVLIDPLELWATADGERVLIGHFDRVTGVAQLAGSHYVRDLEAFCFHRPVLAELGRHGLEWLELPAASSCRRVNVTAARRYARLELTEWGERVAISRRVVPLLRPRKGRARSSSSAPADELRLDIDA